MNTKRLAILLKHANSCPPPHAREEFYLLKQAILERHGRRVGYDVQEIVHKCWGHRYQECDADCSKCGGTGIYSKKIVLLERWELEGFVFHRPLQTLPVAFSEVAPTVHGKIVHRRSKMAFACWRVLTLLVAPQFHLYLDQFRSDEAQLRRFKAVLAWFMGFPRSRWRHEAVKFDEIVMANVEAKRVEMIPF